MKGEEDPQTGSERTFVSVSPVYMDAQIPTDYASAETPVRIGALQNIGPPIVN